MILLIDNYDSFTYNLAQLMEQMNQKVNVFRNDKIDIQGIEAVNPSALLVSPGPGSPTDSGVSIEAIDALGPKIPVLGVCLGHQAIAEVFGGELINIRKVFHGVSTRIKVLDSNDYLFRNIPDNFEGGRYHSWIVSDENLPSSLQITARAEDGEIMGMSHTRYDVKGVQFHPESILTKCGTELLTNWVMGEDGKI
ncbi:hypothetical protein LCGC14_2802720 [marine sediment metagenome]|uniref:Glutamine amidotransferase domain-containing protein n=1 Tax=marine sediment metagenome TaxID=412755 RepID=A0A0F8Z959_9ZZZZ